MRLRLLLAALCVLSPPITIARDLRPPAAPEFVKEAASSNTFEIRSGRIALASAESGAVKAFARQMIEDHTKAASELAVAVRQAGADLDRGQHLEPRHEDRLEALSVVSGPEFDVRYTDMLLAAHDEALALFTAYAQRGDNHTLMAFAAGRRVTTLKHRHMFGALYRIMHP
jgi:putative membrane protein